MLRMNCCILCALAASLLAAPVMADDDFNDNAIGPEWTAVQDDASRLWLDETNQELQVRAAAPTDPATDAIYRSDGSAGFQLLTGSDFSISIDYAVSGFSGVGDIGLVLGIGRDLDGTDSAAVAYSVFTTGLAAVYRDNDVQTIVPISVAPAAGTLTVSYDAGTDVLTLGDAFNQTPLPNLVQGAWGADRVYVSFGARGSGLTLTGGQASLDNFTLTGQSVPVPEPASAALLLMGSAGMLVRRCRRHR